MSLRVAKRIEKYIKKIVLDTPFGLLELTVYLHEQHYSTIRQKT
jgi:hypothetical protein